MLLQTRTVSLDDFFRLLKTKKIIKNLQFYIQSQEAKIKSVWAPILTPLLGKEKLSEFCQVFNKESALFYHDDVYIPVFFIIYPQKQYNFILRTPTIFFILKYLFDLDKIYRDPKAQRIFYYITVEELYFISNIKYSTFIVTKPKAFLLNLVKLLNKFYIKIIIE